MRSGGKSKRALRVLLIAAAMVLVGATVATAAPAQQVSIVSGTSTSTAKKLSQSSVSGKTRFFLKGGGLSRVASVNYFLDDAQASGEPFATVSQPPFATSVIDTTKLKRGAHTLVAVLTTATGDTVRVSARFNAGATGGTPVAGATPTSGQKPRNVYEWPYNWDSIWNLPLATSAKFAPSGMKTENGYIDWEDISVYSKFPVKTLDADGKKVQVHVDPNLEAGGEWNNCAAFLIADGTNRNIIQGQPLKLTKGGTPSWTVNYGTGDIYGDGIKGCHGGSALAGLGGDIRAGELPGPKPIRHALKLGVSCDLWCSPKNNGFRWPATKADSGYTSGYGKPDSLIQMGTMMALPPNFDITQFKAADVRKVAKAMQDYGAYVVDSTGGGGSTSIDVQHGYENELPSKDSAEMRKLYDSLQVVTNSTKATPGGGRIGAPRRTACAPPFANGKGGAPAGKCPVAR